MCLFSAFDFHNRLSFNKLQGREARGARGPCALNAILSPLVPKVPPLTSHLAQEIDTSPHELRSLRLVARGMGMFRSESAEMGTRGGLAQGTVTGMGAAAGDRQTLVWLDLRRATDTAGRRLSDDC